MRSDLRGRAPLAGLAFLVLGVAGNLLLGRTPAQHGDAEAVGDFYDDHATRIAVAMMLSLISVFFLAWFLAVLRDRLWWAEGADAWLSSLVATGGTATCALLAAGYALTSAGALRAREVGISPETAAVFYDGGRAVSGLAASLTMSVLLAGTAASVLQSGVLPRWFGRLSGVLAVLGLVTPVSFVLSLLFPLWVAVAAALLVRSPRRDLLASFDGPGVPPLVL